MSKTMSRTIQKAAVLGAGVMGSGIAALLAGAGIRVTLLDIVPGELSSKEREAGLNEQSPAFRNRLAKAGLDKIQNPKSRMLYHESQAKLITTGNMADHMGMLSDCDWIIEVVPERLDIKLDVMRQIQAHRKPGSVVSTNTSGISIRAIAAELPPELREHFLGIHFFNPPRYMHLLEIIPTPHTSPEVLEDMAYFASRQLGKGIVLAKDTPNFVANRIGGFASINAMRLMERYGLNIPEVDQLTGPVIGRPRSATFRTADLVGLDIIANVSANIQQSDAGEDEKEQYALPGYTQQLIDAGALGNKSGHGFYQARGKGGGSETLCWNPKAGEYAPAAATKLECVKQALSSGNKYAAITDDASPYGQFVWEHLKSVLLYSARKVPEIADDYMLIDRAMVWGYNWEKGPFAIWDALGVERTVARMQADGDIVPGWVLERVTGGQAFFYDDKTGEGSSVYFGSGGTTELNRNEDASLWDIGDNVLCLEFHSRGNAVSGLTIDMLDRALTELEGDWAGLVIGNKGRFFSAGADLRTIAALIEKKDWQAVEELVERLQNANMALKYARKPVVAAPFGTTVGGGAEIVMHAPYAAPQAETYMGLVEAGVGLVPGAGGCKELLLRAYGNAGGQSRQALLPAVQRTWRSIATATVSTSAHDAIAKGYLDSRTQVVMNQNGLLEEAKMKVLELSYKGYIPLVPTKATLLGDFGKAALLYELESMKEGGFVSEYDALIATKLAHILTGGNVLAGAEADETYLLELEREAFVSLCGEEKTKQRIDHMLATGKPLRN